MFGCVYVIGCESGVMFRDLGRLYHSAHCYVVKCPYALGLGSVYCAGYVGSSGVVPYHIECYESIYRWPVGSPDLPVKY